jgi:hypothetical protein
MGVAMASKISTALTDAYAKKWFSYLKGEKIKVILFNLLSGKIH